MALPSFLQVNRTQDYRWPAPRYYNPLSAVPLEPDVDPGMEAGGETEAALRQGANALHHSQFQPRTGFGQFDGAPVYPDDQQPVVQPPVPPPVSPDIQGAPIEGIDPGIAANVRRAVTPQPEEVMSERLPDGRLATGVLNPRPLFGVASPRPPEPEQPTVAPVLKSGGAMNYPPSYVNPNAPVDPTAASVGIKTGGTGTTRGRLVAHGRPTPNMAITDPLERAQDYKAKLDAYEPQKSRGWWNRYAKPMLMGMAAGSRNADPRGQPWTLLGGAAGGLAGGAINPTAQDEFWKAQQQGLTQNVIDQNLEMQKTQASLAHTRAETAKLQAPATRPTQIVKAKDGTYRVIFKDTGLDANGNQVQGETVKSATGFTGWAHDADGVAHYYQGGQDTGRTDPGRNKVKAPDGSLIDPSQKYSADTAAGRRGEDQERANSAARQENARTQANIDAAIKERDQLGESLKVTPRMITKTRANPVTGAEEKYQDPNPVYEDYMGRYRQLDDQIRRDTASLKPIVPSASSKAPPGGYTEQMVRDRWKATPANQRVHKSADDAVAAAKASGLIPK